MVGISKRLLDRRMQYHHLNTQTGDTNCGNVKLSEHHEDNQADRITPHAVAGLTFSLRDGHETLMMRSWRPTCEPAVSGC